MGTFGGAGSTAPQRDWTLSFSAVSKNQSASMSGSSYSACQPS